METNRLEAFSDAVLAIVITVMVLELRAPAGAELSSLRELWPVFLSYVLSFRVPGHLLEQPPSHAGRGASGERGSPLGEHALALLALPGAFRDRVDGGELLRSGTDGRIWSRALAGGYRLLHPPGAHPGAGRARLVLAHAVGTDWKGKLSPVIYAVAIPSAFIQPAIAGGLYALVALIWLIPDRRIERALLQTEQ